MLYLDGLIGIAWQRSWFIASMVNLVVDIFIYQGMRRQC
jgi:hypothetical protein